jgi:CRP/FNR family transcriptional regulator, anaerobic regulatory protein
MAVEPHIVDTRFTTLFRDTFGMNEKEFEMLLSYFEVQNISRKEFYVRPGKVCRHKAYVNKGCLRNYVIDELGHERVLFFPVEDWWVADMNSYYSGEPGTIFIQAIEDCELLEISKEDFQLLEKEIPRLSQWYSYKMLRRATSDNKRISELKTQSPRDRYLNLLNNNPEIFQRIPLQYIASYLSIEPQSLSRLRKQISGH